MQTLDKNLLTNYPCASSSMQWQMHHNMSVNPYNQHFVTPCLQLSHLFLSVATLRKHESNDAGKDNPLPSKTAQTRSPQINATTIEAGFLDFLFLGSIEELLWFRFRHRMCTDTTGGLFRQAERTTAMVDREDLLHDFSQSGL